ncbi:MAG: VWA domain-containing protein, partial [Aureispira sp.]|nr:VWA domain-containing protein [Aureispira sp.]
FHYLNGKSETSLIRSFTIKIKEVGSFIIPVVTMDYKGKKLSTDALKLNIIAKDSIFSDLTKEELNSKVFVRAEFENGKETCLLGERIIINTAIYTQIGIEEVLIEKEVGEGTSVYLDFINRETKSEKVEIEGVFYHKKILRSQAYYALTEKEVALLPAQVVIKRVANKAKSALDKTNLLVDTLSSNSLLLKVKSIVEKEGAYLAKNGTEIKWSLNDSLIDKGILFLNVDLLGRGAPFFYRPPNLDFGNRATVETLYLGREYLDVKIVKKSFQYIIYCHEAGNFDINLNWITWNTETNKKEIFSKSIETINVDQVSPRRNELMNINPIEHTKVSKRDVALVVDCSVSMLAKDFDSTRFQAIQDLLRNLIHQKSNDERFSLVLVAGESFILCPLTFSTPKLLNSVDKIEIRNLATGTDLTAGIMQGALSLLKSEINQKNIVIFTDGVSNSAYLDPEIALILAKEQKIRLNTVGVGIDGEFLIPVAENTDGSIIYEKKMLELEAEELKRIADNGGGIYTRINSPKQLKLDLSSFLGKSDLLLLDKKQFISPELVDLLLKDANDRHQKIRKEYVNIKDK